LKWSVTNSFASFNEFMSFGGTSWDNTTIQAYRKQQICKK